MSQIIESLWNSLLLNEVESQYDWIVRELRLPRVLLALLVGAALASAGAVTQGLFRNPLADPGLIGVSSGAALAAVAFIVLQNTGWFQWTQSFNQFALPMVAFIGSLIVSVVVYRLGSLGGQTHVAMLLLAGIAINVIAGALTGILIYAADDQALRTITFWTMGSLAYANWKDLALLSICLLPVLCLLPYFARVLNALLMGEAVAGHLGFQIQRTKKVLLASCALMVGASVAVTGTIGFLGLVVPHLIRLFIGSDHKLLIPCSALLGACLLLTADTIARTVLAPADLPVGLIMAVIGGPIFMYLLIQQMQGWRS